jgi:hypothetical protein
MPKPLIIAIAIAALAPVAGLAEPSATSQPAAAPDASIARAAQLTAAGFLNECAKDAARCAVDARTIDVRLSLAAEVRRVNNPAAPARDYCEPDGMTDEARRDLLAAYLHVHPELGAGPFATGALKAFESAWGSRCQEIDRARAAASQKLERTTVAEYLEACKSNESACASLTADAGHELVRRAFVSTAEQAGQYAFCYPDLPADDVRRDLVKYLAQRPELASRTLLEGDRRALIELWPNKGEC